MQFRAFNLKTDLLNILDGLGYKNLTKVQELVIPKALKGENIVAKSETGSGKTHSFIVPIINNLEDNNNIQAIIVDPTKELAQQTYDFIVQILSKEPFNKFKVKLFSAGKDLTKDLKSFENSANIIVATPGRLSYLLNNAKIDLSSLKTIVLDEADMLIDKTFIDTINDIFKIVDKNKIQIEVFSATISNNVNDFLRKYISPDYLLTVNEENKSAKNVKHYFVNISRLLNLSRWWMTKCLMFLFS